MNNQKMTGVICTNANDQISGLHLITQQEWIINNPKCSSFKGKVCIQQQSECERYVSCCVFSVGVWVSMSTVISTYWSLIHAWPSVLLPHYSAWSRPDHCSLTPCPQGRTRTCISVVFAYVHYVHSPWKKSQSLRANNMRFIITSQDIWRLASGV